MRRKSSPLVTENSQAYTFTRRAVVLGAGQALIGTALAARMGYISIAENERYAVMSDENRIHMRLIPPRRGWILDRFGHPMAVNRSDFRVDLIPDQLPEQGPERDRILATLQQVLLLPVEEMERIREGLASAAGFQPVPVAENLPFDKYAAVTLRLPELPGVSPLRSFSRYYPEGAAVGHLIGYVGTPSKEEYEAEDKNRLLITPGFKIGKEGLEETMEQRLRGRPGAARVEVTARGRLVRELTTVPDTSGAPLRTTIDAGLQSYAARRMGDESGACVVMECNTGNLLCYASMPAYDPNAFSDGIGHSEWQMFSQDERKPLLNKILNSLYPPGSTLKPMAGLALQAAGIEPEQTFFCGGGYQLGNRFFRCLGRHGSVNMHRAIAKSCNAYFYAVAHRIGYDKIAPVARELGLGEKFELPVVSQRYGTIPDSAWKQRKYDQPWTHSDSLNAVIGQGYVIVNPLQLATMAACIASGRRVRPHLLPNEGTPTQPLPYAPEHFESVRRGMWEVVNGDGTAGRSRLPLPGVEMAGKTGTAQVRRIAGGQRGQGGERRFRDHGLFVFFAPADRPLYAGAVVIEHGMGGSRAAAPVAKDVLTYLFDKNKAMEALWALEQSWGGTLAERMARQSQAWAAARARRAETERSG